MPRHRIWKWVEEHPAELLTAIEDRTEEVIRELERREREAHRALKRPVPREAFDEVPFQLRPRAPLSHCLN